MDNEQIALKLQETTDRSLRNEGRIKKLETETGALNKLATSVAVMAQQMEQMTKSIECLNGKVDALEEKPGKRWDSIVDKAVWSVMAAMIAFMLGRVGL